MRCQYFGKELDLDDRSANGDIKGGWFSNDSLCFVYKRLLSIQSPIMLDIGANVGSFALLPSVIPSLKVYAFEPIKETADILAENARLNNIQNQVFVRPQALWSSRVSLTMFNDLLDLHHSHVKTVLSSSVSEVKCYVTVKAEKLDHLIGLWDRVDFVKIDAEGSDCDILLGAQEFINLFRPEMLLELWESHLGRNGRHVKDITDLMTTLHYEKPVRVNEADYFFKPNKGG